MKFSELITVKEYAEFLGANPQARKPEEWKSQLSDPSYPVTRISATDALAYAQWRGTTIPERFSWSKCYDFSTAHNLFEWVSYGQGEFLPRRPYSAGLLRKHHGNRPHSLVGFRIVAKE